ncbi:MAG: glycoside hydrolase [Ignavibacteriae bacterium]|nr:MAG: glycoside hydrolase [Ignavibacteriota bacterium]
MFCFNIGTAQRADLKLNNGEYYETRGVNVLVFSNWYDGNFSDAKISGIELIHHGVRTATNGDVRLRPTPSQWDSIPQLIKRTVIKEENRIEVSLKYVSYNFEYKIKTEPWENGLKIQIELDRPLPAALEGKAGLNLEFLPSAYFEKGYLMDGIPGVFPLSPGGPMEISQNGSIEPQSLAEGSTMVLAPEDRTRMVSIHSNTGTLSLYDGRNQAQNGWFVVRHLIPSGKTGIVVEWIFTANSIPDWIRTPVIEYSQIGYHPAQKKIAVIEFDKNDHPGTTAKLLKVNPNGRTEEVVNGHLKPWGNYLRYVYCQFDFSSVTETGLYVIRYDSLETKPFRIAVDVYQNAWQPTLDIFLPVQMDHMFVKEAYRVWHGAAHLDDARQAPVSHEHFDLYAQGPTTDTPFKPGEHIPGLNVGGWFDAGDFDIRTQTQYSVVQTLVQIWESFHPMRDETSVDETRQITFLHTPDGKPDLLQQIEHGTLALLAQFKNVGHAIPGIIDAELSTYTFLGDAVSQTDGKIYNPALKKYQTDGITSGTPDDRWAFTSKTSALNYGSIAALAAASRALRGFDDSLSGECLSTAKQVWDEEHSHAPVVFRFGNTTGGNLESEEFKAAVELLQCTGENKYVMRVEELFSKMNDRFGFNIGTAVRAIPFMNKEYAERMKELAMKFKGDIQKMDKQNPFGVPITEGGWAGNGAVVGFAATQYLLHKAFPEIIDKERVYGGLNYLYGCHPASNISFVSGVGVHSKRIAYGNNRADFSFIAGGVVPGALILKPDYPENKEDWPFFWGENEYVVNLGANYIFLVLGVNDLVNGK